MADCGHTQRASCELCLWIIGGKVGPMPKGASMILNQEANRPKVQAARDCSRCGEVVKELVSRNGMQVCEECAKDLDDAESDL